MDQIVLAVCKPGSDNIDEWSKNRKLSKCLPEKTWDCRGRAWDRIGIRDISLRADKMRLKCMNDQVNRRKLICRKMSQSKNRRNCGDIIKGVLWNVIILNVNVAWSCSYKLWEDTVWSKH